jgi:hypothetical protein
VASQFGNFDGLKNYRAGEAGGELVTKQEQALTRIARDPFDREFRQLPGDGVYLRIWSPELTKVDSNTPVTVAMKKVPAYSTSPAAQEITFERPLALPDSAAEERIYALPLDLKLEPRSEYSVWGWITNEPKGGRLFTFSFFTSPDGRPVPF